MNHQDAEMTEMIVILTKEYIDKLHEAVQLLVAVGMEIFETDDENNVVQGAAESHRVVEIEKLVCVSYIRRVQTYIADYPPGDPRDQDGPDED